MTEHSQNSCLLVASPQCTGIQQLFAIHSELGSAHLLTKPIIHNLGRVVKQLMGRIADVHTMHRIVLGSMRSRAAVLVPLGQRAPTLNLWVNQIFCSGRKKQYYSTLNSMQRVRMKQVMNYM